LKERIIEIVERNYTNPQFDINSLASEMGFSRIYINTKFNFIMGCSPHEYLEKARINKAKDLLLEENKIIDVCKSSGYSNKKTFYLAFKRQTGNTPKEFVLLNCETCD